MSLSATSNNALQQDAAVQLMARQQPANPHEVTTATDVGFFAQDDWRVLSNLTLNLGVRYDVEYGTLSDIEYGTNGRFLIDDPRSPYFGQASPEDDKDNIAPRVGFA